MNKHVQVSVKTLTDYHLESFIRCPYKFYYRHILTANSNELYWRQYVQATINKIVRSYYSLPFNEQTRFGALKLINQYWNKLNIELFDSKVEYYLVLAKVTDHLLKFLKTDYNPKLFLYEKQKTFIKELETELSLTIDIAEWSKGSFVIKKYLLETDQEMARLYHYLITVFSQQAFERLPESIEIFNLMTGERYSCTPAIEDVDAGLLYLKSMKDLLKHPDGYTKTSSIAECMTCEFNQKCIHRDSEKDLTNKKILH